VPKLFWKKRKTLAMLANRRQWQREFDPTETTQMEILLENGIDYLVTQASVDYAPTYIITE
jgi:hypothetical protein